MSRGGANFIIKVIHAWVEGMRPFCAIFAASYKSIIISKRKLKIGIYAHCKKKVQEVQKNIKIIISSLRHNLCLYSIFFSLSRLFPYHFKWYPNTIMATLRPT